MFIKTSRIKNQTTKKIKPISRTQLYYTLLIKTHLDSYNIKLNKKPTKTLQQVSIFFIKNKEWTVNYDLKLMMNNKNLKRNTKIKKDLGLPKLKKWARFRKKERKKNEGVYIDTFIVKIPLLFFVIESGSL